MNSTLRLAGAALAPFSSRGLGRSALAIVLLVALSAGCASRKFVRAEVGTSEERSAGRMGELASQIEQNQTAIGATNDRVDQQQGQIGEASQTAREALERALAAGKLAEGTLVSETVLSNDKVRFGFEKAEITDEAKAALDEFAAPLKNQNLGIYIEIQGHTDSSGDEQYNLDLGQARAEAVRRYLNQKHGVPLHRMSVISYGESAPAFDNATKEGREKNRRVVLVVLR